jgi:hypothetical protein
LREIVLNSGYRIKSLPAGIGRDSDNFGTEQIHPERIPSQLLQADYNLIVTPDRL